MPDGSFSTAIGDLGIIAIHGSALTEGKVEMDPVNAVDL